MGTSALIFFFFEENNRAVSVTSACYMTMTQDFLLLELYESELEDAGFQQEARTDKLLTYATK